MSDEYPIEVGSLNVALAYRLLGLCREQDLSISDLSKRSDVPLSTIKNILNGASRNPGINTIDRLCQGLSIKLADFFADDIFELPPTHNR